MHKLGFVGLGVIGSRMAGHLLNANHDIMVWNRSPGRDNDLVSNGAKRANSIIELAEHSDIIFTCVSKSEDVIEVINQLQAEGHKNKLFVDHSTIEPNVAIQIAKQCRFLDAPVTGGEKGAIAGTLTVFCGGNQDDFNQAKTYLECYSKSVQLVGKSGSGQMMKMANQISVAISVLGMAECLVFCEKAGLDLKQSIELIGGGAGGSWSMTNYGPKVLERDWSPGFSVALQQKDLRYALDSARDLGVTLPGTTLAHQLFAELENAGRANDATPALYEVIESLSSGGEEK